MKVGDILRLKPFTDKDCGLVGAKVQPCRVIYIHPQGRFFRVEFQVDGGVIRETRYFPEREGNMSNSTSTGEPQDARGRTNPRRLTKNQRKRW